MNPHKKDKVCLMSRIASLPQIYRTDIDKALQKHRENSKSNFKDENEDDEKEETITGNVFSTQLKEFNKDLSKNKKVYMHLKEENDDFLEKYYKSEQKKKNLGTRPSFHSVFIDLIHSYKDKKGYIIKDLSKKNNLFELSPLLLENNKIIDSYKVVQNSSIYPHDLNYLERLNDIVVEKLNVQSMSTVKKKASGNSNHSQFITSTQDLGIDKNQKIISRKDLLEQIEDNINSINQTKDLLESNVLKTLFLQKGKFNNKSEKHSMIKEREGNINGSPQKEIKNSILLRKNSKQFNEIYKNSQHYETNNSNLIRRDSSFFKAKLNPIDLKHTNLGIPKKLNLKRKQSLIHGAMDRIKNEIEEKVQLKRNEKLEKLVESVHHHEQDNQMILKYLKEKENERIIFKDINKKFDTNDLLKLISDMKKNVELCNFKEFNKEFHNRYGNSGYNEDDLNKIEYFLPLYRKLDSKINRFDYQIIKNMNFSTLKK